ncbi:IS3 family transposase [Spiroplasma endosymbiont of Agriotes lineatus]
MNYRDTEFWTGPLIYNNIRIHGSLNYLTPVEFRKWQST